MCLGALYTIMTQQQYSDTRDKLELGEDSSVLIISTEGDTDPVGFWDNIWG